MIYEPFFNVNQTLRMICYTKPSWNSSMKIAWKSASTSIKYLGSERMKHLSPSQTFLKQSDLQISRDKSNLHGLHFKIEGCNKKNSKNDLPTGNLCTIACRPRWLLWPENNISQCLQHGGNGPVHPNEKIPHV